MAIAQEAPATIPRSEDRPRPRVSIQTLEGHAKRLRRQIVRMVSKVGIGYLQQGLGAADIFAAFYLGKLTLDEQNPNWPDRVRLVLSTAHNTAIFYASMAERGLIPDASLDTY